MAAQAGHETAPALDQLPEGQLAQAVELDLAANVPAAHSVQAGALVEFENVPAAHAKQPVALTNEPAGHGCAASPDTQKLAWKRPAPDADAVQVGDRNAGTVSLPDKVPEQSGVVKFVTFTAEPAHELSLTLPVAVCRQAPSGTAEIDVAPAVAHEGE